MKTASCKAKGRRLQQWVAEQIGKITNLPVGQDEHIAPREMGQTGPDVRLSPTAREAFPYSVECKNQEKWRVREWYEQAAQNAYPGTEPVLIFKRNRTKPQVLIDAEAFFKLFK